jgi:O-antigen/teichoic acid export membrane protein
MVNEKVVTALSTLSTGVKQAASVTRLKPFDTSTSEGRSKERYRRVALTALALVAAKGIGILAKLIWVPLALGYLGTERYGLWMIISSMAALLALADLGMGNGLLNAVSEANGKDDREAARRYVSSAFFVLFAIALSLGALFAVIYPRIPWTHVFNVSTPQAVAEAGPSMAVFVGCFLAGIPLSVARQAQNGYQEGFATNFWIGFGNLCGLCGVVLAIQLEAGLPWLVLALAGAPTLALFMNSVVLFTQQRPWLWPRLKNAKFSAAIRISKIGALFFVLQIAVAVAYYSDNIVVARIFGAEEVAQYAVPFELFMFAPVFLSLILIPLWPAYGEAIARGDVAWVKTTLLRSCAIAALVNVPVAVFLVVFGTQVVHLWVGPEITPSFMLRLGLGLWIVLFGISGPLAYLLNGANVVRFQVICAMLMASANVAFSIILAHLIGLPGVIFGTVAAQLLFILIPSTFYIPRLLSSISSDAVSDNSAEAALGHAATNTSNPSGQADPL